jgi:hypothetical protein
MKESYGATELFRGNLQITIPLYLRAILSDEEIRTVEEGKASLVIRIRIDYTDGFLGQPRKETQFVFAYEGQSGCWSAAPVEPWNALFDMLAPLESKNQTNPN